MGALLSMAVERPFTHSKPGVEGLAVHPDETQGGRSA